MKKAIQIIVAVMAMFVMIFLLSGCRESNRVSYNISREADSFNVVRKITVFNMRTDSIMFEMVGTLALQNSSTRELEVICRTGENEYKKHFIYLNDWTSYIMEDISGSDVPQYHYQIKINPRMTIPFQPDFQWENEWSEVDVEE